MFGQAENLPQLSHHRAVLKGVVGRQECGVGKAFEDVLGDVLPIAPREIEVEIRWRRAVQVDEPFEVEVQLDGVYVGDF